MRARLLALAAAALSTTCGEHAEPAGAPAKLRGAIVILLDTVRADRVSCYGYERPTTPSIDALASRGVRFERAISSSPWTMPSVAALLSGEHPGEVLADGKLARSLVGSFADAGFATAAFTEGAFVSRYFGMDRGFAEFQELEGSVRGTAGGERAQPDEGVNGGIDATFEGARQWLTQHRDRPFFLLVHTYEPHMPYVHHEFTRGRVPPGMELLFAASQLAALRSGELVLDAEQRKYVATLYDGDIRFADRFVGELLGHLGELGLRDQTLVVVTSDHGEELGEHYERFSYDHGHSLYDDLLRVPLVIHDPTRSFPVRSVARQVRLFDVLPTVAELLGVPASREVAGRSLVPMMTGAEVADRVALSGLLNKGPDRIALTDGRHKLVLRLGPDGGKVPLEPAPPEAELYDLVRDPRETVNLAGERPRLVEALSEPLRSWHDRLGIPGGIGVPSVTEDALRERLRSLGYVE